MDNKEYFKTYIDIDFKKRKSGSFKRAIGDYLEPLLLAQADPEPSSNDSFVQEEIDGQEKIYSPNQVLNRELDLFYGLSILVSEGVNKNSDAFLRDLLISIFKTPRNKFVDWEHDVSGGDKKVNPDGYQVIGHIYDSTLATQDGSYIPEYDVFKDFDGKWFSQDSNWRNKALDIIVAWVIYKFEFPELVEEILQLAANNPDTFGVSMEVLFSDYKFRIGGAVDPTEDFSFDANSIGVREIHKGDKLADMFQKDWNSGKHRTWNNLPVIRILGGTVFFSGMAITENRANKRSWNISFAKDQTRNFKNKNLIQLVEAVASRNKIDMSTCNIVNGEPDCDCLEASFSAEIESLNKTLGELMDTVARAKGDSTDKDSEFSGKDDKNKKQIMGQEVPDGNIGASIYLTRHGETDLNSEDCLRGWKNPPLNENGTSQAKGVGKIFKDIDINKAYVSSFDRTVQTAELILGKKKDLIQKFDDLRPINFGDWNGQKLSKIDKDLTALQNKWKKDPSLKPPGDGESFEEFQKREVEMFGKILKEAKPGDKILVVAHLRNCIWFLSYIMNQMKPLEGEDLEKLNSITQNPSNISEIHYNPKTKQVQIVSVNTDDIDLSENEK